MSRGIGRKIGPIIVIGDDTGTVETIKALTEVFVAIGISAVEATKALQTVFKETKVDMDMFKEMDRRYIQLEPYEMLEPWEMMETPSLKNYGPDTRIRPSNVKSHIRPLRSRPDIRLRMMDSRSGKKGQTIRKRLGK